MAEERHEIPVKVVDRRWWARSEETPVEDKPASSKPTYVEELERQIAEKDRQIQEYLTKYRQASQEFDDARARMRKEIARDAERSRREIIVGFLDVIDNLDRAIDAAKSAATADVLLEGVVMVRRQFLAKLESLDVFPIDAAGAFDPQRHEAVSVVPVADPGQDGQIVGVVRQGYRIGEDVLRPALVAVTKADPVPSGLKP
jgi:molecular chaperone GrpE